MSDRKTLLILGAGGYGCTVAEAAQLGEGFEPVGFLDDGFPNCSRAFNLPVFGTTDILETYADKVDCALVAIGENRVRSTLTRRLQSAGFQIASILHPEAKISPSAFLKAGVSVMAGAVIGTEAYIGQGVIINAGVAVDHHAQVDSFAHLGVGSCVAGGSRIQEGAWLRAGCVVGYRAEVRAWEIIAPGTVLGD
jgi:sugar O-acyltransferase (sialic acid O-acetyltransferase NeuD family)